jgi:tetratricopeptide (TPR) repeat protein
MADEFEHLREQGEIASEQGDQEQALICFDRALIMAVQQKQYGRAVNILGHHLHVFKVFYQETSDPSFMELFYSDVLTGLRLCQFHDIQGQPKSVMLLRSGDYFLFKQDFAQAAEQYRLAMEELDKPERQPEEIRAEYMGHYAIALVKSGDNTGFAKFEEALKILGSHTGLRPFHQIIVESGVWLRQADAYAFAGQQDKAREALSQAKPMVEKLAAEHNMGMRKKQWEKLARQIESGA